jgi:predicted metalloprotease
VWAHNATTVPTSSGQPLIQDVNQDDVNAALDTASRIGDDFIQSNLGGGRVDQSQFTHGSSAQREKWWTAGYKSGDPAQCDTFARGVNLG